MAIWMVYCEGSFYSTEPVIDVAAGEEGGGGEMIVDRDE